MRNEHVCFTVLPADPIFLYGYNFPRTKIRIKNFCSSWIPLEAEIQFGPKHAQTMAPYTIRMPSNVPQSQSGEGHTFGGVISFRRVQDDSSLQCV